MAAPTPSGLAQVGTTVAVRNLFEPLPVRRREFLRNLKRDYSRMLALLQAYALISTGVRITCSNHVGKGYVPAWPRHWDTTRC